jgi:hypothetical protein
MVDALDAAEVPLGKRDLLLERTLIMRTAILFYSACVVVLLCRSAVAGDLYVNNVFGNDSLSGDREQPSERQGPVRSIQRALCLAKPGDHIHIAKTDKPYREELSISGPCLRGRADKPLLISGNGAVLDGTVVAASGAWKHEAGNVFSMQPRRLTFQQLYRQDTPLKRVRLVDVTTIEEQLQPLEWALAGDRIFFRVEKGYVPGMYPLRHAGLQTGITLYNTEHVRIENLIVQGFQQDGINAHELARDCVFSGVECRGNGRSGFSAGGVSRVLIEESNFYDNGVMQLRVEGQASVTLDQSEVAASPDAPAFDVQGGELTIDGKPYVGQE